MPNNKPPSVGPPGTKTGKTRYTLKGRIYLFNLEDVITMVKPGKPFISLFFFVYGGGSLNMPGWALDPCGGSGLAPRGG